MTALWMGTLSCNIKMKAISKEMRKRQKYFPWLKTFIKEFLKTYPNCKKTLQCVVENIEKEIKELRKGLKQKTEALFETVNDLYLHFWWKIHWKKSSQWKNYWSQGNIHSNHDGEMFKCFGKLLKSLIYLGIILSQGASNSVWITRVLQAINILSVNDEILHDALLQLHCLKKKYRSSYMEILRHILCSEIILNFSEPAIYIKSLLLFRRLKNSLEDKVAKASLISTASKIKPPSNLVAWLTSLEISIDVNKNIVDQLFKKNSKEVFQKLYHVLIDSENDANSVSLNNVENLKSKKKSEKEEKNLLRMLVDSPDSLNKDVNSNIEPFEHINVIEKNKQLKKILLLPDLCENIKNSNNKKKSNATNDHKKINSVDTESNTKSHLQPDSNQSNNLVKKTLDSWNIPAKRRKSKKKKKSKAKNDAVDANKASKNTVGKSKDASNNSKSVDKSKKSQRKKKCRKRKNSDNVIPDNQKKKLSNLETHSNKIDSSCINDSVSVNNKLPSEGNIKVFDKENSAIKKVKPSSKAENKTSRTIKEKYTICEENSEDKISNKIDLNCKLPNLLMNYEIYSSEENEMKRREASSCPLKETGEDVLVPDTCQNDIDSIVPFNLDSWIPTKDETSRDTSNSNDGSLVSDKYSYVSLTGANVHQNNHSDNSNSTFNDSSLENLNDSEVSRDTFVSYDGSQISDKYPYVSVVDIRKNKKLSLYLKSDYSNSSSDSFVGNVNDSEISQDTCISNDGSQISNKNPYVSLVDIRKAKNLSSYAKSDSSNSNSDNSFIGSIHSNEMSQDIFMSKKESNKDPKDIKDVDEATYCYNESDHDTLLGSVRNVFNQNSNNSLCNDLCITENNNNESQSIQVENHHGANENKDSELSSDETITKTKEFLSSQLSHNKHSKAITPSVEQDDININHKTKQNSPTKRKRKETSCNVKKQQKRKYSCDGNKNLVSSKKDCHQDLETSTKDVSDDTYVNDLSTLLANHGVIETQENDTISPSTNIGLNHSDTQEFSQFQKHNTPHEKSNILSNELNEKMPTSCTSFANVEKHPCITLTNENHQNDVPTCSIETVINEFFKSELSKVHTDNLNSVNLTNHVTEKAHAENEHSSFQTPSNIVPSDCFCYKSNTNTPKNDNERNMLSVSSSATRESRSVENEVAQSLLNLSVNENSGRLALSTSPGHKKENPNVINANLNSGNSSIVVDCNIINDFDSRNSSRAGSSVSGDATTIKVVLNLINAKQENCSNVNHQSPNSSGNSFLPACNSSQNLPSSIASAQGINNSNCSIPMYRNNGYFNEPPFFVRRTTNELDTPPDSESHLSVQRLPRAKNYVSLCSEDKTNFILSKSKSRSSTPKKLSRKRQHNEFLHSSESANEWQVNQCDLNSSFSNIPTVQTEYCEDVLNPWNVHQKGSNIHSAKGNLNEEPISRFEDHSAPIGGNNVLQNHRQAPLYRNSRPNIYSDESEDELSVGTMSLLSGEETDHSLLKAVDAISPKTPLRKKNKNKTKKLFREEKWALDTLNAESSIDEKSTVLKEPTPQKKIRQKKVVRNAKRPKSAINHDYNLRSRNLLTPPTKLKSYIT